MEIIWENNNSDVYPITGYIDSAKCFVESLEITYTYFNPVPINISWDSSLMLT